MCYILGMIDAFPILDSVAKGEMDVSAAKEILSGDDVEFTSDEVQRRVRVLLDANEQDSLTWCRVSALPLEQLKKGDLIGDLIDHKGRVAFRLTANYFSQHGDKLKRIPTIPTKPLQLSITPVHESYLLSFASLIQDGQFQELTEEKIAEVVNLLGTKKISS